MTTAGFRCSLEGRTRGDQLAGTAAPARAWVLVEYRGGWPFGGFAELDLPPEITSSVRAAAQAAGARILLIRKPGRRVTDRPPAWAVLQYAVDGRYRQRWGEWSEPSDLLQITGALTEPGERGLPPVLLVCTHGVHDVCCALSGRPIAAQLQQRWPQQTWECSHVGGDRFAPNLVVAPDGVYFAEADADVVETVVQDYLDGQVDVEYLRGYCDLTPPQQVAVAAALRRYGPAGRHAFRVVATEQDGAQWEVRLAADSLQVAQIEVVLHAERTAPARLTCRAPSPTQAIAYRVVSITASAGSGTSTTPWSRSC